LHVASSPSSVRGGEASPFDGGLAAREAGFRDAKESILERIARAAPLSDVLRDIVVAVEKRAPPVIGSILLLDRDGVHIRHGAAPNLPEAYCTAIDGVSIGPNIGSCGTAAYEGRPIFVEDIEHDPRWAAYRDLALAHGLRACWSTPILSTDSQVLGTFAMYYTAARRETEADVELIRRVTDLASIAIERHRTAEQLEAMKADLAQAQKMEAIGKLAGGVAHDFNNLLAVILGVTSAVIDSAPPDDPLRTDLGAVIKASERASALTGNLLAFCRKQVLVPRALDLNAAVGALDDMLRTLAGPQIEIVTRLDASPATVLADPVQMEQVIVNLVVNARDAMPEGGRLEITTSNTRVEARTADGLAPGPYITLSIRDDGQGMDEETRRRIFEPFFTTKPTGRGTGLGLAIVWGVVNQSGGKIEADSRVGQGTVFRVHLPQSAPGTAASARPKRLPAAEGGVETLLVVDPDPLMRTTLRRVLGRQGYTVLEAENEDTAVALARSHPTTLDLVIADRSMLSDATAFATTMHSARPQARFLCISGAQSSTATPGVVCLPKPFTSNEILEKIRSILDGT
jgi:two-component system, cell cycle sensor histidine kinase and response regulator CckA